MRSSPSAWWNSCCTYSRRVDYNIYNSIIIELFASIGRRPDCSSPALRWGVEQSSPEWRDWKLSIHARFFLPLGISSSSLRLDHLLIEPTSSPTIAYSAASAVLSTTTTNVVLRLMKDAKTTTWLRSDGSFSRPRHICLNPSPANTRYGQYFANH